MTALSMPNNPSASCTYCRVHSVGTPAADNLVCVCEVFCGAGRCAHAEGNPTAPPQLRLGVEYRAQPQAEEPYGPPVPDLNEDRVRRWNPHPRAIQHARALLKSDGEADFAVIPMFQPGKDHGWWRSGQPVHTVFGVVLLSVNTHEPTGKIPSHSWARDTASAIAAAALRTYAEQNPHIRSLGGEIGTVAYAVVSRGSDHVGVHEDGIPDERHTLY